MTKRMERKVVLGYLDIPQTSLEKVVIYFQQLLEQFPGSSLDYEIDYDGEKYYQLVRYVEESDEAYQLRLKQEELEKESYKQKEIRLLKELQEKYKDAL